MSAGEVTGGAGAGGGTAAAPARIDDAGTPSRGVLLAALLGAPVTWSAHLLAAYAVVAYACSTAWGGARTALVALSIVALAAVAACGVLAWRAWRRARHADRPVDDRWDARMGERTAHVSFLMVGGLMMAVLFGLAVLYQVVPVLMSDPCSPGASL